MNRRARRHLFATNRRRKVAPLLPTGHPVPGDRERLASLLLDAYRGSIDDDGETLADARAEVTGYFAGAAGEPHLEASFVAIDGADLVSACLVSLDDGLPLIAYAFTAARWKGRGLGSALLQLSLNALAASGHRHAHLWVTAGNVPAERIYERFGFAEDQGPAAAQGS